MYAPLVSVAFLKMCAVNYGSVLKLLFQSLPGIAIVKYGDHEATSAQIN